MLKDVLNENLYDATLLDFHFQVFAKVEGLEIHLSGFSDKFDVFCATFFTILKNTQLSEDKFLNYKEKVVRKLKSTSKDVPYSLIGTYTNSMLQSPYFIFTEQLSECESATFEDVKSILGKLLGNMSYECFFHGNITPDETLILNEKISSIIKPCLMPDLEINIKSVGEGETVQEIMGENPLNSAIEEYFQISIFDDWANHALALLSVQVFSESFFDILRTKEQLGYVVSNSIRKLRNSVGIRFLIQSEKPCSHLKERIQWFLTHSVANPISAQEYQSHKQALKNSLMESKKVLSEETNFFWMQIVSKMYFFDWNNRIVVELDQISVDSFYKWAENVFVNAPRKVSVRLGKRGEYENGQ